MKSNIKIAALFVAVFALIAVGIIYTPPHVLAYNKLDCNLPPFLGVQSKPNFLMVVDYSGSMQQMANINNAGGGGSQYTHVPSGTGWMASWTSDEGGFDDFYWNRGESYFGPFNVNRFYKYDPDGKYFIESDSTGDRCELEDPPEIQVVGVMKRPGYAGICFCTGVTGSSFNPGDYYSSGERVLITGLDTPEFDRLNDREYRIYYVGTASWDGCKGYIRVEAEDADIDAVQSKMDELNGGTALVPDDGIATREVRGATGSLDQNCISGHLLNWMGTTRIDATRIALVGGKGEFVEHDHDTDPNTDPITMYERRAEGMKILGYDDHHDPDPASSDYYSFSGAFYRRTGAGPDVMPDGKHHTTHYRYGQYHDKDVYLTIANVARGWIDTNDDLEITNTGCNPPSSPTSYSPTITPSIIASRSGHDTSIIFPADGSFNPPDFAETWHDVKIIVDPSADPGLSFMDNQTYDVGYVGDSGGSYPYLRLVAGSTAYQNLCDYICGNPSGCGDYIDGDPAQKSISGITVENISETEYGCPPDDCGNPCEPNASNTDCVCGGSNRADLWTFTISSDKEVRIDLLRADRDYDNEHWDPKLELYRLPDGWETSYSSVLDWLKDEDIIEEDGGWDTYLNLGHAAPYKAGQNNDRDNYVDDDMTKDLIVDNIDNGVQDLDSTLWSAGAPHGGDSDMDPSVLSGDDLVAGTYVVVVTTAKSPSSDMDYVLYTNDDIKLSRVPHDRAGTWGGYYEESLMSSVGTIFDARLRVRLPEEEGRSFIQDAASHVRFGWMEYTTQGGAEGKLIAPCKPREDDPTDDNDELDQFVDLIKGKWTDSDGDTHYERAPRGSTPSGEALAEAYDYFSRSNHHSGNADNSHNWDDQDWGDPYMDPKAGPTGDDEEAPCRKSVAILLSDGEWNQSWDPLATAWELNTGKLLDKSGSAYTVQTGQSGDMRSDMDGIQNAQVYSIFAFGGNFNSDGAESLKGVAAFGSFVDNTKTGCGGLNEFPYPYTGIPTTNSKNIDWPVDGCDPDGVYDEDCCREWDLDEEKYDGEGNLVKGIPDNFFLANDANQLRAAMERILADLMQSVSAAGAVATVSQEVYGGDLVIRAAFEADDPANPSHYAWYGHLEGYWPYQIDGVWTTEYTQNPGSLCHEIEPHKNSSGATTDWVHCWDAAEATRQWLETTGVGIDKRKIYTRSYEVDGGGVVPSTTGDTVMELTTESLLETGSEDDARQIWSNLLGRSTTSVTDAGQLGDLVNWIRGAQDDVTPDLRRRFGWIHGDIVYSTPVIGGIPPLVGISESDSDENPMKDDGRDGYHRFRNRELAKLNVKVTNPTINDVRKKVTFVGANDGMVHAVVSAVWDWDKMRWVTQRRRDKNGAYENGPYSQFLGRELWSFIPTAMLAEMKNIASDQYGRKSAHCPPLGKGEHRTMVDLSPKIWQVYIRPPGGCPEIPNHTTIADTSDKYTPERCWRNVLIGGFRGGGDQYFALDVTDVDNPILLWEYSVLEDLVLMTGANPDIQEPTEITDNYEDLKFLPMSWTIPFCGRIKLPDKDVTRFYTGAPPATPQPFSSGIVSVPEFDRTLGGLITDEPTSDSFYSPHKRHLAFIACKFQYFEQDLHPNPSDPIIAGDDSATMKLLRQPHMLAIDIETGENLFKYVWPWVYSDLTLSEFPKNIRGEFRVPCSFSDPSVIDVWNTKKSSIGSDGYVDHIFMGDLCGNLWGLKLLNFDEEAITSDDIGLSVEMWPTRAVRGDANTLTGYDNFPWSNYRTDTQPITHRPAISLSPKEDYPNQQLRIIFGTGKYDDTYVRPSDREDPAIMSLYNLAYPITPDVTDYDVSRSITEFSAFNMYFKYRGISRANMFDSSQRLAAYPEENTCRWTQENTLEGDCCKRDSELNGCPDSPDWWKCVYDFTLPDKAPWGFGDPALATTVFGLPDPSLTPTGLPGERVLHRPLIANDYVYVTTYIPPTKVCEPGGRSYLYVFDYMCRPFPDDFQPPDNPAFPTYPLMVPDGEGGSVQFGAIIDLGEGLASEAVLSGEHLIIQMTDGTILNPEAIDPPKGVRIRAWREVASD